ncbi:MAG: methyltransferase domain-containing protein [Lachnospiraceae bacterium]|nr:methyltransferase domain-containing protein [Lachnospiraceae bacterium]
MNNKEDKKEYFTSGQLAKMAKVSVRTIRFYDTANILKPSIVNDETGARFYVREDFLKLEQILLYKYLGFSLDEIKELMLNSDDKNFMLDSLRLQNKLVDDKIEQMQLVKKAINETLGVYEKNKNIDWDKMLKITELTGMENSLNTQYRNSGNISARIELHKNYSNNKKGWFPWLFEEIGFDEYISKIKSAGKNAGDNDLKQSRITVLEIGCGNGAFWRENIKKIPADMHIILSDVSLGMINDARTLLKKEAGRSEKLNRIIEENFEFREFNANSIPLNDESVDIVIANHMLFYFDKPEKVLSEIKRVLKKGGFIFASTYGSEHMKEITDLVKEFDERIALAAKDLYLVFGLENGEKILKKYFSDIRKNVYDDFLFVDKAEPLLEYIMSCHGNQRRYIPDRYKEFKAFVEKKTKKGFKITKDSGYFKAFK